MQFRWLAWGKFVSLKHHTLKRILDIDTRGFEAFWEVRISHLFKMRFVLSGLRPELCNVTLEIVLFHFILTFEKKTFSAGGCCRLSRYVILVRSRSVVPQRLALDLFTNNLSGQPTPSFKSYLTISLASNSLSGFQP